MGGVVSLSRDIKSRSDELITINNPKSPVSEAYRAMRTNISFLSPDKALKSIVVTSSGAGEGKSLTLANFAITLVQNEQNVIIIDADLRKPMQHRFFNKTNFEGLSNILTDEIGFEDGLRKTDIDGLRIISSGVIPPNPAELLASKRMSDVIEKACKEADLVLIDAPPAIAVTDAAILANKTDGVILVIASHETHADALLKAKENLDNAHANILGTVLNKYPIHHRSNYYSYYYYYGQNRKI
jgi:capsular exopolysaccharide synthesis family protein